MAGSIKMTAKIYVIGNGPAPKWCAGLLAPFQRLDGKIGYEFYGANRDFDLCFGDMLIKDGWKIKVKRMVSTE